MIKVLKHDENLLIKLSVHSTLETETEPIRCMFGLWDIFNRIRFYNISQQRMFGFDKNKGK